MEDLRLKPTVSLLTGSVCASPNGLMPTQNSTAFYLRGTVFVLSVLRSRAELHLSNRPGQSLTDEHLVQDETSPAQLLQALESNGLKATFPNVYVVLRMFLTLPDLFYVALLFSVLK